MERINDRDQNGQPPLSMTHEEKIAGLRQALSDQDFVESLHCAFPKLDVDVQEKYMIAWIRANPEQSNRRDWQRFIQNWLAQEMKPPKWVNSMRGRRNR